jgi:hypothetical protein
VTPPFAGELKKSPKTQERENRRKKEKKTEKNAVRREAG